MAQQNNNNDQDTIDVLLRIVNTEERRGRVAALVVHLDNPNNPVMAATMEDILLENLILSWCSGEDQHEMVRGLRTMEATRRLGILQRAFPPVPAPAAAVAANNAQGNENPRDHLRTIGTIDEEQAAVDAASGKAIAQSVREEDHSRLHVEEVVLDGTSIESSLTHSPQRPPRHPRPRDHGDESSSGDPSHYFQQPLDPLVVVSPVNDRHDIESQGGDDNENNTGDITVEPSRVGRGMGASASSAANNVAEDTDDDGDNDKSGSVSARVGVAVSYRYHTGIITQEYNIV